MAEIHGHVASVVREVHGSETTAAALAAATTIFVADTTDFVEGGDVLIGGEVYTISDVDEGDSSGAPSITLSSGLLADVANEVRVDSWNASTGAAIVEWFATVTDDVDGTAFEAPLTHSLIALFTEGPSGLVGESVVARQDDAGDWWVVEVVGATPAIDPGYFRTGTLSASTTVIAGTEGGKRVQMDGTGTPAFEAYDSSNNQTVNIDGEVNYVEGTLATSASGARVEIGAGLLLGDPVDEARIYSGHADEDAPAFVRGRASETDPGVYVGELTVSAHDWSTATGTRPSLLMTTGSAVDTSLARLGADSIDLSASGGVSVIGGGNLNATMGTGSVGTGTFRDSVDARVTAGATPAASEAVAGKAELATQAETNTGTDDARIVTPLKLQTRLAAYAQPLDATLTGIGNLAPVAADRILYTTGSDTFSSSAITAAGRALLDDASAADMRTTLLAAPLRWSVVSETGTTKTIGLAEEAKYVQHSNTSAITVTLPSDTTDPAVVSGFACRYIQLNTGTVTFVADAGVTINSRGGLLSMNGRYSEVTIRKRGANLYIITGDLA